MAVVSELELPFFDHTDSTLGGERYREAMSALHGYEGWLAQCPFGFMVLDREAAEFFLRTKEALFPGLTIAQLFAITDGPLHEEIVRNIININGADHSRLRSLVNPALAPRAIDRYRPAMRTFLAQLIDELPADGRCEFIQAFAKPYPSLVIAAVMGAPLSDGPRLYDWSNWIQRQFDANSLTNERQRIEQAVEEFYVWADALIAQRRQSPGDDLITDLIAASTAGEAGVLRASDSTTTSFATSCSTSSSAASTPARASSRTRCACSPAIPTSGSSCAPTPASSRSPRSTRRCATSRSRRSPRGSRPPRSSIAGSCSRPTRSC